MKAAVSVVYGSLLLLIAIWIAVVPVLYLITQDAERHADL